MDPGMPGLRMIIWWVAQSCGHGVVRGDDPQVRNERDIGKGILIRLGGDRLQEIDKKRLAAQLVQYRVGGFDHTFLINRNTVGLDMRGTLWTGHDASHALVANAGIKVDRPRLAGQGAGGTKGQTLAAIVASLPIHDDIHKTVNPKPARGGQKTYPQVGHGAAEAKQRVRRDMGHHQQIVDIGEQAADIDAGQMLALGRPEIAFLVGKNRQLAAVDYENSPRCCILIEARFPSSHTP